MTLPPEAYPLFIESELPPLTSPKQLNIGVIHTELAVNLNKIWHSRVPIITNPQGGVCYGAEYGGGWFASAIWTMPIARMLNGRGWLELRRMAISPEAPKFTATRMISLMVKDIKVRFPNIIRLISYQDTEVHKGTIYKASNWVATSISKDGDRWTKIQRKRPVEQTTSPKIRWEYNLL